MLIGSHVSMSNGLPGAVSQAISYNANTFMIYTGAPQNTRRTAIDKLGVPEANELMKAHGIQEFVVHAPYIINLASYKDSTYELAVDFLKVELDRTKQLGSNHLVLHPGAFTDMDVDYGTQRIIDGLNSILTEDSPIVCLETMAGKGTEIGRNFSELKRIIDGVTLQHKVGVCFDTCHVHDSGYDLVNDLDGVMKEFDEIIGLDKLHIYHINGSLNVRGAKKDRHANIGALSDNPKGADNIGFDVLYKLCHSEYAQDKFLILETPWLDNDTNLYKEEIQALREGKL